MKQGEGDSVGKYSGGREWPRHGARLRRADWVVAYLAALIVLAFLAAAPVVAEPLSPSQRFQFELWAQNHCPTDAVVWVDGRSQFYNSSEERWYGRTTNGAFVCKRDAENAGYRLKAQR